MLVVYTIPEYKKEMLELITNFPPMTEILEYKGNLTKGYSDNRGSDNLCKGLLLTGVNEVDRKQMLGLNSDISMILGHPDNLVGLVWTIDIHFNYNQDVKTKKEFLTKIPSASSIVIGNTYTYINNVIEYNNTAIDDKDNHIEIDTRWYDDAKFRFCLVTLPLDFLNIVKSNPEEANKKIMSAIIEDKSSDLDDFIGTSGLNQYLKSITPMN